LAGRPQGKVPIISHRAGRRRQAFAKNAGGKKRVTAGLFPKKESNLRLGEAWKGLQPELPSGRQQPAKSEVKKRLG